MADDKEMVEQEQNDLEQSAGVMADTAQGAAKTGRQIADKVHESEATNNETPNADGAGKNLTDHEQPKNISQSTGGLSSEESFNSPGSSQHRSAPQSLADTQIPNDLKPSDTSQYPEILQNLKASTNQNSPQSSDISPTESQNIHQSPDASKTPETSPASGALQASDPSKNQNDVHNPAESSFPNSSEPLNESDIPGHSESPTESRSANRPQLSENAENRLQKGNGLKEGSSSSKSGGDGTQGSRTSSGGAYGSPGTKSPKPQLLNQGQKEKSLTGNPIKKNRKKTGKAIGSGTRNVIRKAINQIREMFHKLMLFLGPYLLAIFLVTFIIIILVFVAYTIAFRYKGSSNGGGGNYSYNWIVKESGSLDEEEKQNNAVIIYGKLKNEGWSLNAIAAAIGNWDWESGLNPARWEGDQIGNTSGGYGLAQWTPATKIINWLSENGYEKDSGDGQLQWIIDNTTSDWIAANNKAHMTGESFIHSTEDAATLARYYCQSFERGAWTDTRATNASKWYTWLKDNGDSALAKLKTSSTGTYYITIAEIQKCKSKQEYLDLVMPCYQDYCKQFGIKYPGILALQVYYEVGSGFPQQLSNVAIKDNNLGGLKYSSGIPGATSGTSAPANEGSAAYCHFESVGDYFYAQCWQIGQPLYANARSHQSSVDEFARALCNIWIGGRNGTGPYAYSENLINDYKAYNLSKWEG